MVHTLYNGFLENRRIYNLVEASWRKYFDHISNKNQLHYKTYINNKSRQGKLYDGNPIFSAYFPEVNRAVRIIQVASENNSIDISAWLDKIDLQKDQVLDELVIDLALSREAKEIAKDLIEKWVIEKLSSKNWQNHYDSLLLSKQE